ncbi:MAG: hypothetical protein KKF77_04205 [Proteobacteria bacterium]|nr:hypothetical protein [Pseudomonadota bacterium]
MQYTEFDLTDLGYVDGEGKPLASIAGRDNQTDPFRHLGYEGYPAAAVRCIDVPGDIKTKTLAILPDGEPLPEDGTVVLVDDVVDLLVAEYGWPEGTTLAEGIPVEPERRL